MQRILVPYDQSDQSAHALAHALSTFDSARIVLLHVVEPFADHTGAAGYEPTRVPQRLETAREMLTELRAAQDDPERIETAVRYGRPSHTILRHIETKGIDHVVMGSQGRDGVSRLLLGSVAESVARRSSVPVTIVRGDPDTDDPADVLVPFDGSTYARRALEHALDRFPDADITALYVVYPPTEHARDGATGFEVLEEWEAEREHHAESVLGAATELAGNHGRDIETLSTAGKPTATIVDHAASTDHVVMGSQGRDGVSRLLLGSVAETVVRRSSVSVTIAK